MTLTTISLLGLPLIQRSAFCQPSSQLADITEAARPPPPSTPLKDNPQTAQNDVHLLLCPVLSSSFSTSTTTCGASIPRRNVSFLGRVNGGVDPCNFFTVCHTPFVHCVVGHLLRRASAIGRKGLRPVRLVTGAGRSFINFWLEYATLTSTMSPSASTVRLGVRTFSRRSWGYGALPARVADTVFHNDHWRMKALM